MEAFVLLTGNKATPAAGERDGGLKAAPFPFVFQETRVVLLNDSSALTAFASYKYRFPRECPVFPDSAPAGAGVFPG